MHEQLNKNTVFFLTTLLSGFLIGIITTGLWFSHDYQSPEVVCCSDVGEHLAYDAGECLSHQHERSIAYDLWLKDWMDEIWNDIRNDWDNSYINEN